MEALGSTFTTTTLAAFRIPRRPRADCRGRAPLLPATKTFFVESGGRCSFRSKRLRADVRMDAAVGGEEEETRQAKEMAAARRRWESLIREQKVKVLTPREAGYAIQLSSKALLDVRPSTEHEKAWVRGSTWIPIFDIDKGSDVGALSRKITNFIMGGWWSGSPMLAYDKDFVKKVEEKFPKDTDIIVVCQKGLRSLAACEQLYNAGFKNLFWVQGGLEASEEEDFAREGPQPFKLAGIGGVSEFLGWTDQQCIIAKEGWSYWLIFTGRLVVMSKFQYLFDIKLESNEHYRQGRLELLVDLHRTSARAYSSGGCFVFLGLKSSVPYYKSCGYIDEIYRPLERSSANALC